MEDSSFSTAGTSIQLPVRDEALTWSSGSPHRNHSPLEGESKRPSRRRGPIGWGGLAQTRRCGAATRNRTPDLLITSELLYLLSYGGMTEGLNSPT